MKRILAQTLALASALLLFPQPAQAQGLGMFGDSGAGGGASSGSSLAKPPLSWQKVRYEEKILESLNRDIAIVLPPDQFVVTVDVKLRDPNAPQRNRGPKKNDGDGNILGGNDLMSKLGVDSPALSPDELRKKDDLFENIASIDVEVVLDEKVDKAREEIVQKLVARVAPSVKALKAKVNFSRLQLTVPEAVKPKPKLIDWVREFKDPAGRILALVLFAFAVFVVSFLGISKLNTLGHAAIAAFKEYVAVQQEAVSSKGAQASIETANVSGSTGGSETSGAHHEEATEDEAASNLISSQHDKELAGIEKFKKLVSNNPQAASMFVRQWIKIRPEGSIDALIILTRSIQPENLVKLFELMSVEERKTLSKILNSPLSKDALGRADLFLNNQIIMDLITPKPNLEPAMQELLMGVTDDEITAVAQRNATGAAALLIMLPSAQMVKIADALPNELCEQIFPICATLSSADALTHMSSVRELLTEIRGQGEQAASPFIESVPDLMSGASLNKERILYSVLASSKQWSTIDRLAHKQFPAVLVSKLPVEVLKEVFLMLSNVKRAELVISQEDDVRRLLLSSVGEPGKKLRDMLDLEVKELDSNADTKEKIQHSKDKIWMDFVKLVRQSLKSDPNFAKATKTVLAEWQQSLREVPNTPSSSTPEDTSGGNDDANPDTEAA